MRCKNARTGQLDDPSARLDPAPPADSNIAWSLSGERLLEDGDADAHQSDHVPEQDASNLVAVDTKRISDFASLSWFFPASALRLIVGVWFLYTLIGWRSLLMGMLAWLLTVPTNIYVSRRYSSLQGDLMQVRDQKLACITEALQAIRQIKFSALEPQWEARVGEYRSQELALQWKAFVYQMGLLCLLMSGPVLLSTVSLVTYACIHPALKPSVAFTTIAIFGYMEFTLAIIPELVTNAIDAWISVRRVDKYMNTPDQDPYAVGSDTIVFEDASVAWPYNTATRRLSRFHLRAVNLRIPPKGLTVISGKTGSGKSLLLTAILGKAEKLSGTIKIPQAPPSWQRFDHTATKSNWIIDAAMAYVAQVPWIENATIRGNILFGLPFDQKRYEKTLSVCALRKDLDLFPDSDLTDIGANGVNLSGGQRWRVSFARALYSRAGILVLDDVLSSLDAQVGRQLLEQALAGDLGVGRTRILVTHHIDLCQSQTRYAIFLGGETVEYAGLIQGSDQVATSKTTERRLTTNEIGGVDDMIDSGHCDSHGSLDVGNSSTNDEGQPTRGSAEGKKFTEDESRETGSIQLKLYKKYVSSAGGLTLWVLAIICFIGATSVELIRAWWVSRWTRAYQTESASSIPHLVYQKTYWQGYVKDAIGHTHGATSVWPYLAGYVALSVLAVAVGTVKYAWAYAASIRASRVMFDNVLSRVLRAPLRWLDTVPVGRILNRFTADFSIVDSRLINDIAESLFTLLELIGISVAGFLVSPFMIVFAGLSMGVAAMIGRRYLSGAREVKRLESIARSPVLELFDCVRSGIATIMAYDKLERYIDRMQQTIDDHTGALMHMWLFNQWMSLRLSLIAACFASLLAALVVVSPGIDASLAGFALSFALRYNDAIIWTIRSYASLEMDMNATERLVEYSQIETEPSSGCDVPAAWPDQGRLEINDLVAGYAPDEPPVLKGLSFTVEKNARIGIVGRTGAGKSSLTRALFRFLEAREGTITIDGIDISQIKLRLLRSRLTIIPQDPVLFSGTVRSNLDPDGKYGDTQLHAALETVYLTHVVDHDDDNGTNAEAQTDNVFNSLSTRVAAGGLDFSQGQRQLLCLARAILSRPKIMILDEATSAVDKATDTLIQRSIHREFKDSTLLVIAHRLTTVADFDRILVMSDGKAVEYGAPRELMEAKGRFWDMVCESGDREMLEEMMILED
ncbi:MAG: hypothetical protein Q9226_005147 [Calogaya cf. arnoldii]